MLGSKFWSLIIEIWDLPFDFAQSGEPVEPFGIWCLLFGIYFSGLSKFGA